MPGLAAILRARCPWSFRLRALVEPGGPPASGMVGLTDYPAALRGHASSGTGWLSISGRGHGAQAIRVICRRPCAAEGGQDSHVQEDPEGTVAAWLRAQGASRLAALLEAEAASGRTVAAARRRLLGYWKRSNIARRLAERQVLPEDMRRESEHAAVAGLVKRIRHPQGNK